MGIDPRIADAFVQGNGFELEPHLLLLARIGSHSHGTWIPPTDPQAIDDTDYMGIIVPPQDYTIGVKEWEGWNAQFEELDLVFYSLQKAVRLLLKSNPNVLGLLWLRAEDYVHLDRRAGWLLEARPAFSSLNAYPAFIGYAHGQLKRMTTWNDQIASEYEAVTACVSAAGVNVANMLEMNGPDFERGYRKESDVFDDCLTLRKLHKKYFSGYMGEKRKGLVRKHGYDAKNAAHLIRLMRMCVEFLETGVLSVYRPDAEELKAIKQGEWSLEQIQAEADRMFTLADAVKAQSTLPAEPKYDVANSLSITLHRMWYA